MPDSHFYIVPKIRVYKFSISSWTTIPINLLLSVAEKQMETPALL
jgi:hypothetical protein